MVAKKDCQTGSLPIVAQNYDAAEMRERYRVSMTKIYFFAQTTAMRSSYTVSSCCTRIGRSV